MTVTRLKSPLLSPQAHDFEALENQLVHASQLSIDTIDLQLVQGPQLDLRSPLSVSFNAAKL
jgi:hypothetical protein